jgi:hypothetical protein
VAFVSSVCEGGDEMTALAICETVDSKSRGFSFAVTLYVDKRVGSSVDGGKVGGSYHASGIIRSC